MNLNIGIIGCRGIPNHYGGFEQFAEYVAQGLNARGHKVSVYNSSSHPYQQKEWNGIQIIHCQDPEHRLGTMGQFIYDFNCVRDSAKRNFDILLFLGYTSSSIWGKLSPRNSVVISNMDGLEWMRTKYSKKVQHFLGYAESLAVKHSDFLIADSIGIQLYLRERYGIDAKFIAYGASLFNAPNPEILKQYKLIEGNYDMVMARMEPENNIEVILDGYSASEPKTEMIVVGNTGNSFGKKLVKKYTRHKKIRFLDAIYDASHINNLRYFSRLYFHGHSVGGTNPSLLEAMACNALIVAHNNIFNRSVLQDDAIYFSGSEQVRHICNQHNNKTDFLEKLENNRDKIKKQYDWNIIIEQYDQFFQECFRKKFLTPELPSVN